MSNQETLGRRNECKLLIYCSVISVLSPRIMSSSERQERDKESEGAPKVHPKPATH